MLQLYKLHAFVRGLKKKYTHIHTCKRETKEVRENGKMNRDRETKEASVEKSDDRDREGMAGRVDFQFRR